MLIMFERLFPLFLFLQTTPTPTHPPCARDGVHSSFFFGIHLLFWFAPFYFLLVCWPVLTCTLGDVVHG